MKRNQMMSASSPAYAILDRRNVIKLIGSACAVSSLSGCVIADVFTELGETFAFDLSDSRFELLNTIGEAVDVDDAAGRKVILIRINETEIMAVDRICTHTQCDMKLGGLGEWDGEKIICKCHNSHFAPNGDVLNGPATRPLPAYSVNFDGTSNAEIIFNTELSTEAGAEVLVNPFEGDDSVLSDGAMLYQSNCVFCHGEDGVGDAFPGADAFNIDQSEWTDTHLFNVLTNGISGTSMGAYKDTLSEEERWKVVSYLRSLRTDQ